MHDAGILHALLLPRGSGLSFRKDWADNVSTRCTLSLSSGRV
jgi:hypothetical protein